MDPTHLVESRCIEPYSERVDQLHDFAKNPYVAKEGNGRGVCKKIFRADFAPVPHSIETQRST